MGEVTKTSVGLLLGLVKLLLFGCGLILVAIGLLRATWSLAGVGIGLTLLSQLAHAVDEWHLDTQLRRWATEAVAGVGPIPPRRVRKRLIEFAWRDEGIRGDVQSGFFMACRAWAAEQSIAGDGGRSARQTWL